jgi:hypothetical protein
MVREEKSRVRLDRHLGFFTRRDMDLSIQVKIGSQMIGLPTAKQFQQQIAPKEAPQTTALRKSKWRASPTPCAPIEDAP